ncbi:MAG: cytochrome b [Gammaproteobacteria bacterium]|nr:cytochrome b [Gammaproteobacteria bacterium]
MLLKNTRTRYGIITILLHWIMAILIIGLFFLGQYMVDLDYYDSWYQLAPWWHKGFGFVVFIFLLIRFFWRIINIKPDPLLNEQKDRILQTIAEIVHKIFYILLVIICLSGYFISTAKGVSIEIFGWFNFPSIMTLTETQAELTAKVHEISTQILIALVLVHALAALKHHFINRDKTLVRILKTIASKEHMK